MKADITRRSYRTEKHYSRTIQQQGRVPLDADWNEQVDIQEHREHVGTIDVVGRTGVPKGESFAIEVTPGKRDLRIRPGRLYAEGLLCELEGTPLAVVAVAGNSVTLPALTVDGRAFRAGEWVELFNSPTARALFQIASLDTTGRKLNLSLPGSLNVDLSAYAAGSSQLRRAVTYAVQPDLPRPPGVAAAPAAPALDASLQAGKYIVYLDVWQRHITALDDPSIREPALGGPDTCTRLRTVWQLRLQRGGDLAAAVSCADLFATPAPHGRLAARAQIKGEDKPCELSPTAGYRRLENQLYRVEVHAPGPLGTATFKYSRENGSVHSQWTAQHGNDLQVASSGRDRNLGFAAGQWIELIDDERDLKGTPGTLVKLQAVKGTTLTVEPTTATGSYLYTDFGAGDPAGRNSRRIRRWDHTSTSAAITVAQPGTNDGFLNLESGIEIRFESGEYSTGDSWIIPARTLLGEVFDWPLDEADPMQKRPLAVPPEGIAHHLVPLAVVSWDAAALGDPTDCRAEFPPLSHICAEDVCVDFKEGPCSELGLKNVQEALEHLCAETDLKFHNQHLHGWGVVCGLQVHCLELSEVGERDRPREFIKVETGYAIHPSGSDIRIEQTAFLDLGQMLLDVGLAQRENGKLTDANVSLWVDKDKSFHIEKYEPGKFKIDQLLQGTIWWDFYHHCIGRLIDFLKNPIPVGGSTQPGDLIDARSKLLTSIINLFWQLVVPQNGSDAIYLSGDATRNLPSLKKEDDFLYHFFTELEELLGSETFCAMFADIQFPAYDVYVAGLPANAPRPTTIFGKNFHTRLRLRPGGKFAVTMGTGSTLNVYDLTGNKLIQQLEFPYSGAKVVDVAFGPTSSPLGGGTVVYVLANVSNTDSVLAVGSMGADGKLSFAAGQNQIKCGQKLSTLAVSAKNTSVVYAVAPGVGIFSFNVALLTPAPAVQFAAFNASGHLVAADDGQRFFLFAGADDEKAARGALYNKVLLFEIAATNPSAIAFYLAGRSGSDDIAVIIDKANKIRALHVIVEGVNGGGTTLMTFPALEANPDLFTTHEFDDSGPVKIAYNSGTGELFAAFGDTYRGQIIDGASGRPLSDFHPLQIVPCSVAGASEDKRWYVLNWISNTITSIPGTFLNSGGSPVRTTIDLAKLKQYRIAVITAFLKVVGRFLQYLKDCFCEQLLIKCPDGNGKVYLADIAVKNGIVHQICNFSIRRYVHTFPTVEYWMSLVPLLPLLKRGVAELCCAVLPGFFDNLEPPKRSFTSEMRMSKAQTGLQWLSALNLRQNASLQVFKLASIGAANSQNLSTTLRRSPAGAATEKVGSLSLLHTSTEEATRHATARHLKVTRVRQVGTAEALLKGALTPVELDPGESIELLTDRSGKVIAYERASTASAPAATPAPALPPDVALKSDVAALNAKLAERDKTIAELSTDLGELQVRHQLAIKEMSSQLAEMRQLIIRRDHPQ